MMGTAKAVLAAFVALTVLRGAAADGEAPQCDVEKEDDCPQTHKCATGSNGWAQCLDCTAEKFLFDCPHWWDSELIASAEKACGRTCVGHRGSQCVSIGCGEESGLDCVSVSESWAQCVDCSEEAFQADCGFWSDEVVKPAEDSCKTKCAFRTQLSGLRESTADDDENTATEATLVQCSAEEVGCPVDQTCAVGKNGWKQCVTCTAEKFLSDCPYWDAELIASAEKACGRTCVGHRGSQCYSIGCDEEQELECVSISDTWAQCVDCSEEAFQADCGSWSEELAAAAESSCKAKCGASGMRGSTAEDDAVTTTSTATAPMQCDPEQEISCPSGLACASGSEGWAQCVDCTAEKFLSDCPYWDAELIASAEKACGRTCVGHRGSQCYSIGCDEEQELECVSTSDTWAQCVDCSEEAFQADCGSWSEELAAAAESSCKAKCASRTQQTGFRGSTAQDEEDTTTAAPVTQCSAEEVGCPVDQTCAVGKNGWKQCVTCTAEKFLSDCPYWDAELIASAEKACGRTCVGHRGSQCYSIGCDEEQELECVSTSDTWAQCVDCSEEAFQADCGSWSDEMGAAAEDTCEAECRSRTRLL